MSTLWTPDGEQPVGQGQPLDPEEIARMNPEDMTEEQRAQLLEQLNEMQAAVRATPVAQIVANHAYGLFELAAVHLGSNPPNLDQASVAIDALGGLIEALPGRLGDAEEDLTSGLAQLRLAFVQVKAAVETDAAMADLSKSDDEVSTDAPE